MRNSQPPNTMRTMTIAIAGSAGVAGGMMFVPVAALEGLTSLTGLSELMPAISAPLGDFARAMIAFGTGAITLGGMTLVALRQAKYGNHAHPRHEPMFKNAAQYRTDIIEYVSAKMPWHQEPEDDHSFANLARFKVADVHADTPARPPLLASQDLPDFNWVEPIIEKDQAPADIVGDMSQPMPLPMQRPDASAEQCTRAMVNQFETAVAHRHHKRAERNAAAVYRPVDVPADPGDGADGPRVDDIAVINPDEAERPVLERVAPASVKDDDIDSALAAALATLHRMTVTAR